MVPAGLGFKKSVGFSTAVRAAGSKTEIWSHQIRLAQPGNFATNNEGMIQGEVVEDGGSSFDSEINKSSVSKSRLGRIIVD
jgi:hypothetical protein